MTWAFFYAGQGFEARLPPTKEGGKVTAGCVTTGSRGEATQKPTGCGRRSSQILTPLYFDAQKAPFLGGFLLAQY